MKIRSTLCIIALVSAFGIADFAVGQGTSGDTEAHHTPASNIPDGVLRLNGILYIVSNGTARRIDLADGQMATLDGVIHRLPTNYTAPAAGARPTAATPPPAAGTTDRERAVVDPRPR